MTGKERARDCVRSRRSVRGAKSADDGNGSGEC